VALKNSNQKVDFWMPQRYPLKRDSPSSFNHLKLMNLIIKIDHPPKEIWSIAESFLEVAVAPWIAISKPRQTRLLSIDAV
jgi:hypothetical protein